MAYAILRFAKHKGGASKALSAHHERTKEVYASNPDNKGRKKKRKKADSKRCPPPCKTRCQLVSL